jgi:hypothetical protein
LFDLVKVLRNLPNFRKYRSLYIYSSSLRIRHHIVEVVREIK